MVSKRKNDKSDRPTKDKGGRPPVSDAERRDTLLRVLVNEGEWDELHLAAGHASLPVSSWVRVVALERAREIAAERAKREAK
jgi:hypothetical protein